MRLDALSTARFASPRASSSSYPRRVVGRRALGLTTLAASNAPGNAFAKFVSERFNNTSPSPSPSPRARLGPTNEIIDVVEGIARKRLGGTDIVVSEMALGTQRWGGADANSPDAAACEELMNRAILERGVNLIDTAEQYPIPSDRARPEGTTERIIGEWLAKDARRREKVVLATKITGGANVTKRNIKRDLEGSLRRFKTDYIDVYTLHWPARYTPQSNWGQSLEYDYATENDSYYRGAASFEEIAEAMGELIAEGKLRGWGSCNDNAFGLTGMAYAARAVGAPPPCVMQGDFSLINRRSLENGLAEASSPIHENAGWMAYNVLAGGVLTGKYRRVLAAVDNVRDQELAEELMANPRGRMDDYSWGRTLYRYRTAPALRAVDAYAAIAEEAGISLTELALRWCREKRFMTTALVGHTSPSQLDETLDCFDASLPPLGDDITRAIDVVHMRNRLPIFSSERYRAEWGGRGEIGERVP